MKTNEGEAIVQMLEGYIELILKTVSVWFVVKPHLHHPYTYSCIDIHVHDHVYTCTCFNER